jgi:carboxyl-terminal processing protease
MTSPLFLLIPWLGLTAVPISASPPPDFPALGQEILTTVRGHFLDAQRGVRWAEEHAGYADGIRDRAAFRDATRNILADLGTSHTQYYTRDDPGYFDLLSIFEPVLKRDPRTESLGLAAVEQGGSWFVAKVFGGGPAEAAGLKRGDRLVSADGEPFHPVLSLRGKSGKSIDLQVQSRADEPLRTLRVTPRLISPKEEWLEDQRRSSKIVEHDGRRIAYAPLWSCAGSEHQELLEETLQGDLAGADALVIDFRGGWGGCDPRFVQLFDPAAPDLTRIARDGSRTVYSPGWRKPLAVLVDGGTRSGKEVVSRALQKSRRAILVGDRTAGAVVAGQILPLSDDSLLFLAVQDILVDGERLEGVGVTPDVEVPAALPFAEGKDPQLEAALGRLHS